MSWQRLASAGKAEPGGVRFEGGTDAAFLANLWLSTADRVQLVLGKPGAQLRGAVRVGQGAPWEDYLPRDARFPNSQLRALPADEPEGLPDDHQKPSWSG